MVIVNVAVKIAKKTKINNMAIKKLVVMSIIVTYVTSLFGSSVPLTEKECARFCRTKKGPELTRCLESCPGLEAEQAY